MDPSHDLPVLLSNLSFAFSLFSTAAVVFTVASLYTSKPVTFSSTISAIPRVFKRLFITFLWVSLLMLLYNSVILIFLVIFVIAVDTQNVVLLFLSLVVIFVFFLVVHVYITALWHLASVVSVLEPIYGIAAMKKSYELLKGRARMAAVLVFGYLAICGVIGGIFGSVVVHGGDKYGVFTRIVVGGFFVGVLVIVNLGMACGSMINGLWFFLMTLNCRVFVLLGLHHPIIIAKFLGLSVMTKGWDELDELTGLVKLT
ncbi:hypothetical protein GH714_001935 [Hevea brasiliensis]|uniref:Transmembrane protein n=1 Tax=Hevea brasiliensis TaxID=3981 RepID=A0A6A6LT09_HEVBR|nr:hypothetical protein GH714_001935 [Hevea brasiliensis]